MCVYIHVCVYIYILYHTGRYICIYRERHTLETIRKVSDTTKKKKEHCYKVSHINGFMSYKNIKNNYVYMIL